MSKQNWFANEKNFEMFNDCGSSQSFYNPDTQNIYIVSEEAEKKGTTVVQEITAEAVEYNEHIKIYNEWKSKQKKDNSNVYYAYTMYDDCIKSELVVHKDDNQATEFSEEQKQLLYSACIYYGNRLYDMAKEMPSEDTIHTISKTANDYMELAQKIAMSTETN